MDHLTPRAARSQARQGGVGGSAVRQHGSHLHHHHVIELEGFVTSLLPGLIELDLELGMFFLGENLLCQGEVLVVLGVRVFPKHGDVVSDRFLDLIRLDVVAGFVSIQSVGNGEDVVPPRLMLVPESFGLGIHGPTVLLSHLDKEDVLLFDVVELIGELTGEDHPHLEELSRRAFSVFKLLPSRLELVEKLPNQTVLVPERFQRFQGLFPSAFQGKLWRRPFGDPQ
jgi:hypothetical protein